MNWLNKFLNVRPGEWSRLLLLSIILILSNIGSGWGMTVAYAAFLKQAGLTAGLGTLVWVLFLGSVLSILALSVYTAFVDRIANDRLFAYIILAGGGIILLSMVFVGMNLAKLAFPLLYVLSLAWLAMWNPQFFTYVNDLFDLQSAKRTLPLILATGRIGAAVAGFTLKPLTTRLSTESIIWIWFLTDVLVVVAIWAISFTLKKQKRSSAESAKWGMPDQAQKGRSSYIQSLKEGWNFTLQSNFLRWMAVGTLLLAALVTLLEYYVNKIIAGLPQFASSADYAGFLGLLDGISNLIALSILLFLLSRMTKSWGIGNTILVYPFGSLLICGGLIGSATLIPASFAYLNRKGLRLSLQSPIESLLYNAIPLRIKGRARAFVGGLLSPVGAIVAVLILLVELWYGSSLPWLMPGAIALFSLSCLGSAFAIRYQYTQALVKMLEEEDYSFLLSEGASELTVADPATLTRLQKKLEESRTHEMRIFMTQLIAQVGGAESLSILIPAIKAANEARTRAAMLEVVTAAGLRGDMMRELYVDLLGDSHAQVRRAAASGLEQLLGAKDAWLQEQWLKMIGDSDTLVSLYALQSLAGTGGFYTFEVAVQKLDQLLESHLSEDKKNAINVLEIIAQPKAIEQLLVFLEDSDDQVRLESILGLEKLALPFGSALDEKILEKTKTLLLDPVGHVRQATLKVIGKFRSKENYSLLISALADKNPQVRAAAVDILAGIGKDVVPAVQINLDLVDSQTRKTAAAVLSRINPRQFVSLIDSSVSENLNNIYQNIGLEQALTPFDKHRSVRVLLSALREGNNELIDEILYLLSAIHDPKILQIIGESLHSDSSATRNLALEALESLTSPQTAALIASLFEPSIDPEQLFRLGQGTFHIEQLDLIQGLEKLLFQAESRILVLLTLHVIGDIGADLSKAQSQPTDNVAQGESPSQPARISLDLLLNLKSLLEKALSNPDPLAQQSVEAALQKIAVSTMDDQAADVASKDRQESKPLSVVERMIILKEVFFFRNIPVNQLEMIAMVCEEKKYRKGTRIFRAGDPGGSLYIVVEGQVGVEQETRAGANLLATIEKDSYFGEMSLFDNSPRSASVVVLKDSLLLELNRAPIFTLTMQNPSLALELINILSQRIRETSDRMAGTARSRPRELHKLYDQFG